MKTLFTFLLLLAAAPLYAQGGSNKICGIYFDYDALGNRVKRSYDCRSADEPIDPPTEATNTGTTTGGKPRKAPPRDSTQNPDGFWGATSQAPLLFPNPTSGLFTLQLPSPPEKPLHFHWYNQSLQILGSGTISGPQYKGDISAWPDGVYLLQVYHGGGAYSFKVVKATGVHGPY